MREDIKKNMYTMSKVRNPINNEPTKDTPGEPDPKKSSPSKVGYGVDILNRTTRAASDVMMYPAQALLGREQWHMSKQWDNYVEKKDPSYYESTKPIINSAVKGAKSLGAGFIGGGAVGVLSHFFDDEK